MADISRLVETRELNTDFWQRTVKQDGSRSYINYNEQVDALTLLIVPPETRKIVHYIDENVALLYEPEGKEIIGVRIESFQRSFLPVHNQLERVWRLSGRGVQVNDFGDLIIAVQRFEETRPKVANEISKITGHILQPKGIQLEPVPA